MPSGTKPKYYLVEADMLPEVFIKVMKAKELLETGEVSTVAKAVEKVGISRSAYYKYKDSITPFQDLSRGHIVTFNVILRDRMGVLSSVLAIFAESGANILTINQSLPINGTAIVTITAETSGMNISPEEFFEKTKSVSGVIKIEVLAG
ncbi:MAG TPA: ACT domain-containing protein [Clostridiales bacterium]|nr:ACT domain-containing protein [Clostridiales bacterium]